MLKIKNNIDLKELEKYGFEYDASCNVWSYWFSEDYGGSGNLWIKYTGELMLENVNVEAIYVFDLINKLISDGLVENVEK